MPDFNEVVKQRDALQGERNQLAQLLDKAREELAELRNELERRDTMLRSIELQIASLFGDECADTCIHDLPMTTFCSACGSIRSPRP